MQLIAHCMLTFDDKVKPVAHRVGFRCLAERGQGSLAQLQSEVMERWVYGARLLITDYEFIKEYSPVCFPTRAITKRNWVVHTSHGICRILGHSLMPLPNILRCQEGAL